jgi:hypothetical protein
MASIKSFAKPDFGEVIIDNYIGIFYNIFKIDRSKGQIR